jgi:tyrosyl-tRNA synthetase
MVMKKALRPIVDKASIDELTTRAIVEIYPSPTALAKVLQSGKRLTVYLGIDPTSPDLHVGHISQLLKLRQLQKLNHRVILLIGDFTAMIGDPSDKSAARVQLTREEVLTNATGYKQQVSKILDFNDPVNPVELRFNSEWLSKMSFYDVLELASEVTVQQMLERDMFQQRLTNNKPIGLHEFLYPIMQGQDSLAMDVDIEIGGSDQIFNMLVGSTFIKRHKNKQKYVIAGQLLVDPSGRKIGKTEGNMITLNDTPLHMFHKIMLWDDGITPHALELCTDLPMFEVKLIKQKLESGELSGQDGKMFLAETIVKNLYDEKSAAQARQDYLDLTDKNSGPEIASLQTANVNEGESIIDILVETGLANSKSAARRLIEAGGVRINKTVVDVGWIVEVTDEELILQVGKKLHTNFRNLIINKM